MSSNLLRFYVYGIRCERFVKIGASENPIARLDQMRTGNPYPLELVWLVRLPTRSAAFELESMLHRRFEKHLRRGEWFNQIVVDVLDSNGFTEGLGYDTCYQWPCCPDGLPLTKWPGLPTD